MSMNIKNPKAYKLAKAIQRETGESMTQIVIDSLRMRHDKLREKKTKATYEELLAIANRFAADIKKPVIDHADFLYDERGLPK